MRVKLDESVPHSAVAVFAATGNDTHTVADEDLVGRPDADVPPRASPSGGCS